MATKTTTTFTETHVRTDIRFDPGYVRTVPGILKVAQIVLSLLCLICCICGAHYWQTRSTLGWAYFVCVTAFWVTGILLIFYLLHVIEKFHVVPWALLEMVYCAVWTIFYFSVGIDSAVVTGNYYKTAANVDALAALSFFAFANALCYAADAFLKMKVWKAKGLTQGERRVQQSQSTT